MHIEDSRFKVYDESIKHKYFIIVRIDCGTNFVKNSRTGVSGHSSSVDKNSKEFYRVLMDRNKSDYKYIMD